jgi:Pla-1/cef family extracellular lipase
MKKLVLSVAIASILGLTACDDESIKDVQKEVVDNGSAVTASARVVFNPSAGVLSVPNDLLFSGTTDGTLFMPDEKDTEGNALSSPDYLNPSAALGALDGWSTVNPFSLALEFPAGKSLNTESAGAPGSVRIFEAVMGASTSDADCVTAKFAQGHACKIVGELAFGTDFVTAASGGNVAVVPLQPLKADTTYILVMTDGLVDNNGDAIEPSTTYELVRQDIKTLPLGNPAQLGLQSIINSFEAAVEGEGVAHDSIIYSMAMTTQSIQNASQVLKSVMLSQVPGTTPVLGAITDTGYSAANLLGLDPNTTGLVPSLADVYTTTLTMPYYLDTPNAENCTLSLDMATTCASLYSWWKAMGDSPVTVLGALQSGKLSQESFATQAIAQGADPAELLANPSKLVGMNFKLQISETVSVNIDQARHLTQYNPLPQVRSYPTVEVAITMPDVDRINGLRMMQKGAALTAEETLTKPAAGWPTMIYSHGITTHKETVYAIAGTLANAGVAVIAIDHPYHGSRGIDLNDDGVFEISATDSFKEWVNPFTGKMPYANANVTSYMNLASLLTARDNVRESEADLLALRLSLSLGYFSGGAPGHLYGQLDAAKVSFLGHSLGGITGTAFMALANTGVINPATGEAVSPNPYGMQSASLAMPGGGIPGILLNSPAFAPIVMAGLTATEAYAEHLADFAKGLNKAVADLNGEELAQAYQIFATSFNFAAQTIIDAADPINYAATLKATMTPIHVMEIVGDEAIAGTNKPDQVIVNYVATLPSVGTEPLIKSLGLTSTSSTTGDGTSAVNAAVRFLKGHHGSILSPAAQPGIADDAIATAAVTTEMQKQVASFAVSGGKVLVISDSEHLVPVEQ